MTAMNMIRQKLYSYDSIEMKDCIQSKTKMINFLENKNCHMFTPYAILTRQLSLNWNIQDDNI